jgi:hypothetical protein
MHYLQHLQLPKNQPDKKPGSFITAGFFIVKVILDLSIHHC